MKSLRSVFERRFRHADDEGGGKRVLLDENGAPTLVVTGGQLRGVRAVDGSLIPLPERRIEDIPDTEWNWGGSRTSPTPSGTGSAASGGSGGVSEGDGLGRFQFK